MANKGIKTLGTLAMLLALALPFSGCKTTGDNSNRVQEPKKMETPYDFNKSHYLKPLSPDVYLAENDYIDNQGRKYTSA